MDEGQPMNTQSDQIDHEDVVFNKHNHYTTEKLLLITSPLSKQLIQWRQVAHSMSTPYHTNKRESNDCLDNSNHDISHSYDLGAMMTWLVEFNIQ